MAHAPGVSESDFWKSGGSDEPKERLGSKLAQFFGRVRSKKKDQGSIFRPVFLEGSEGESRQGFGPFEENFLEGSVRRVSGLWPVGGSRKRMEKEALGPEIGVGLSPLTSKTEIGPSCSFG